MSFLRTAARVVPFVVLLCAASLFGQGRFNPTPGSKPAVSVDPVSQANVSALFEGAATTDDGRIQVLVELEDPSAAVIFAEVMQGKSPRDPAARGIAAAATRAQVSKIRAAQDRVAPLLAGMQARELYRVQKAINGIAVAVEPDRAAALATIKGVKRVLPIIAEYPTNSTSVPFIGTPNVWANTIGLPAGADGTGIRMGVIDTGLDYMHADFGGTGVLADYQAESTDTGSFTTVGTATAGSFPTTKVIGGTDFAGDAYTGANAPAPDANPMDCNGHGSHVAGSAAGFGVTAAGATFPGPYDANTSTYTPLRIGPGTAPQAQLYGLRVFGCSGSTGLTTLAIDWTLDPNGDLDLSDHLDVINMSLGSNFGTVTNASSVSSDNAALAGVIVVASAGNASDTFFISGAPGAGSRVIATAASVDDGIAAVSVTVNSPGSIAGSYLGGVAAFGPAPSGQTSNAVIAVDPIAPASPCGTDPNDGCCALTNAAAMLGNICVVNRGTCSFKTKALNCQNAGAIGTIIVNNAPGSPPPGMADDPLIVTAITIPTEMITIVDGTQLKNTIIATPPVNVTLNGANGGDTVASFSSRGPRRIVGSPLRLKPDIAAPGLNITSVQTGKTCLVAAGCTGVFSPTGFQAGNQTLTISGTSMASPHMAGVMALLRQLKPDWSVEELKALAMNYAIQDMTLFPLGVAPRFGPARIGSGRVSPAKAAVGDVIAMNAEDAGVVSVTFSPEMVGAATQTRKIRVVNKGVTPQTYDLAFDNVVDSPGVAYSLPGGSSVTVPAGETVELDVLLTATPASMDHTRDASLFTTQGIQANYGDQPRNFLTEEGSYLTFSQSATLKFRLPVYVAERPASTMSAPPTIVTGGSPTGSTTIPLSGGDICTGTLAAGPTCTGTFPTDIESLVTPFELQVVSPLDPINSTDYADIHYVGAAFIPGAGSPSLANDLVMFGVASWGDWSTPNDVAYDICIDNNNDGVYDKILYNTNPSIFVAGASANDNFVRVVRDTVTNGNSILGLASPVNLVNPNVIDTALHLNNVMLLAANPTQLGYTSTANTSLRYKVVTCPGTNSGCARTTTGDRCSPAPGTFFDQEIGPFVYNWSPATQGLNFGGNFLDEDLNGNALPVSWNTANMTTNGSTGALLLHHHNKAGTRAEVVLLDTGVQTDLAVTAGSAPSNPPLNSNVTITVNLSNVGTAATGVSVFIPLPSGLTWVSDDSAGLYNPATGFWTVPVVAIGTQSLNITATVTKTDPIPVMAQITANTPNDTNPANNQSAFVISAPRSGDLLATMTTSAPTANPGQAISYTITLKNNGIDPAYSIDVADSFPAFPALAPTTATPSTGVFDMPTKTWNLAGLGSGITATLVLGLNAPNMAGPLLNSATATSTTSDPNAVNNTDAELIQIISPSNVTGTKGNTGQTYIGGTITYTITLNNSGPFDQQDNPTDEFVDVLPPTMTLVSANASSGTAVATIGTNTVTWNGVVPTSGPVTITVTATVNGTAVPGATITNNGTIHYDANGDGTNEATNPVSSNFVVTSPATLTATKTVAGQLNPSGAITYTVIVSNSGPATQLDNPGDEFTDVLPATLTLVSANATSGTALATVGTNTVTWNGTIAASGSVTITINATVSPSAVPLSTISNQGTFSYDADGNQSNEASGVTDDPGTGAANDTTSFVVTSPSTISATKTASGAFQPDSDVTFTIIISNSSSNAQLDNPGDEFIDILPATLALVSANATSGTALATIGTNTVTWNGLIAGNGSVTITIVAHIPANAAAGTTITNQGTVNFDGDGNGTNESSATTDNPSTGAAGDGTAFVISSPATIASPSKDVSTRTAMRGDTITYTITITNSGTSPQSDNPGDEFVDVLSTELDLVSATADSGTAVADIPNRTVHWNGPIPVAGSVTITITAVLNSSATGTVSNQGTVNFDSDGNGTNDSVALTNDPDTTAANDPTIIAVAESDIPALSTLGLLLLSALLAAIALLVVRRAL